METIIIEDFISQLQILELRELFDQEAGSPFGWGDDTPGPHFSAKTCFRCDVGCILFKILQYRNTSSCADGPDVHWCRRCQVDGPRNRHVMTVMTIDPVEQ